MAIVIEDLQMERLAQQLAKAEGVSITEVVRESLLSLAGIRGLVAKKQPLRERLAVLAREVDALPRPPAGSRTDNDILGYNEHGIW
ncbi:type II toxin-antitoxin system VapB family antitoxin [Propionivibrio sp.]|uniref:type II toxin-antitoxin system VapB family antitoxin n=1 Tax=Propionivibrio sp. TaxID=2212460 RepID=UPI002632307E|nr:type II toxin-antitoxin system VapB family antitoxin [Propionivibrio sp.]